MAGLAVPEPRKLPVWQTVGACYAIVARNLGQLVRISWLWLLIMVPVYVAVHWLALRYWETPEGQTIQGLGRQPAEMLQGLGSQLVGMLPFVVELPFLASIAVAWHRLILRRERATQLAYLRLDKTVWLYVLYTCAFLVLIQGPLIAFLVLWPEVDFAAVLWMSAIVTLAAGISLLVLPRLSLVLPAVALGERLSLGQAWRITRGNTLRLALATCLCLVPAGILIMLPLLSLPFLPGDGWENLDRLFGSLWFAVSTSLAYAVLIILAVTLLSLTYSFFATPGDARSPPST